MGLNEKHNSEESNAVFSNLISNIIFPEQTLREPHEKYKTTSSRDSARSYNINDNKNFLLLIDTIRDGLSYKSLNNAEKMMPFSSSEWANMLHISKRSIDRLKKEKKKLNLTQSEKLIEITLLFDYGTDVFNSTDKFVLWLDRKSLALGGIKPKTLLDTNQGIKAVKSELSRIEHGVLA